MTALATALDIPDEPRRQRRSIPAALIGGAVWIAIGVVVARTFALGGYTQAWLAVGVCVALPATVIAWLLAGPHRRRTAVSAAVMIVGVALIPLASAGATPSPGRLAGIADDLRLPGETLRDVRIGNGRCRPACSELRRTAVARGIAFAKVRARTVATLRARGFEVRIYPHRVSEPQRIDAKRPKLLVSLALRWDADRNETRMAEIFIADGPAPDHSVG